MIIIVDYNAGNLQSVRRACDRVGLPSELSADPEVVRRAQKLIFPGVGAAESAMATLEKSGLAQALREAVAAGVPTLGICLGAQIVLERSEEGPTACLGLLPGETRRFALEDPSLKVPHIGFNEVVVTQPHPLLAGLAPGDELYFVHSYFPAPALAQHQYAIADHGGPFTCALGRDNLFSVQFHPEKSGQVGLSLLARFAAWEGS
jgi:glutamine amidotransferase